MADQLATVSKKRLFQRAGILSQEDMHKIEEAIKIQLDMHKNWPKTTFYLGR